MWNFCRARTYALLFVLLLWPWSRLINYLCICTKCLDKNGSLATPIIMIKKDVNITEQHFGLAMIFSYVFDAIIFHVDSNKEWFFCLFHFYSGLCPEKPKLLTKTGKHSKIKTKMIYQKEKRWRGRKTLSRNIENKPKWALKSTKIGQERRDTKI